MIRSALIALGLSAGAASALFFGAGSARAQGMVRAAPIVEVCGGTRAEQPQDCGGADARAPVEPRDDGQTSQVSTGDQADATLAYATQAALPLSVGCSRAPFHRNVVFQGTLNGSDPSADFCP